MLLWVVVGSSLLLSVLLPFLLKPLLHKLGVLDVPNERSSHRTVVIRGVGITVAVGIVVGLVLSLVTGLVPVDRSVVLIVTAILAAAALLGWIEDYRGLSIRLRALLQVLIGAIGTAALAWTMEQSFWWVPFGALAVAAYINAANFMDGINGISGLHGILVGVFYAIAGSMVGQFWLTVAGLVVAAAFAGFLPWNLGRGFVFLGDVGSYLLGASIAGMAVAGLLAGVYLEYLFSPVIVYLADTFITFLRRVRAGERWYASHREHVYQRLTDVGLSHLQAALVVTVCSGLVGAAGFVLATASPPLAVACSVFAAAVVALYINSPRLLARHPSHTGRIVN
ncbi:UDP-phosphate glycosyltransferase [Arthrobacter sp. JZ12]|uniref:MraY family glycosyltransferase n=1 Tax=Arthrobacter sp. JZ12 TaxID=2654190 RepID=UPI002B477087|nr:glycosyltransferase family 4 protein [Arthrobacter sp. JZ12]WRH25253.1 UDP-phosphate glycosyltransferase [Arthrobacter sp. JZ12]